MAEPKAYQAFDCETSFESDSQEKSSALLFDHQQKTVCVNSAIRSVSAAYDDELLGNTNTANSLHDVHQDECNRLYNDSSHQNDHLHEKDALENVCVSSDESPLFDTNSDIGTASKSEVTSVSLDPKEQNEPLALSANDYKENLVLDSECKRSSSTDSLCSDNVLQEETLLAKIVYSDDQSSGGGNVLSCQFNNDITDSSSEYNSEGEYTSSNENGLRPRKQLFSKKLANKNGSGPTVDYYEVQLDFLEKNNQKLLCELAEVRSKLSTVEAEHKKRLSDSKVEFDGKLEKISKLCEALRKEKEAMVIRYAHSEKEVIISKKNFVELEKKIKDANKDRDILSNKVKSLQAERSRLCSNIEQKVGDLNALQRENEKHREEISCKDIKIKWVQNKLKTEMDSHKETQGKLEHSMQRLQEMREEAEQVRRDCQEMVRRYQEAEEIKSVKLDHQLKQKLSELEVQKQERSDQEEVYQLLRQELEALKKKQRITIEENNSLTLKIHSLEKERLEYEQTLSKLKDSQNSLKQEIVDLTAHLAEMENLSLQLEREREKFSASVREVERLRQTNAELQSDMDACHMKEGELLEFTEKLTAKTVYLQSEHSLLETKAQALEEEVAQLNKQKSEAKQKIVNLTALLEDEKKQRQEEVHLLARKLAEKTKIVEQLTVKLEEADNENRVMKRRHITSIKELSRELQQCRRRVESYECNNCPIQSSDKTSLGSRASSSASLDTVSNPAQNAVATASVSVPQVSPPIAFSGGKVVNHTQNVPALSVVPNEVNKQMLVERIVKLQKMLAKRNDKIEFLEDHIGQLVKEMKKKTKIIQNYIVKAETGALVSNSSDQNKLELSKRGGIMASVYRSQLSDNNMTLELSLEINNKLQAVLEDTLLKNITLKENINTLGEEIARLTSEKRELTRQITRTKNPK